LRKRTGQRSLVDKDIATALSGALAPLTDDPTSFVGGSIRAQRTRQVIRRAENARALIAAAGLTITGAPLKFIVPWAEAASIEDESDEDLNGMWERLLANASVSFEHRYLSYIEVLRGMSAPEAHLLNELCHSGSVEVYYDIKREWIGHIVGDAEAVLSQLEIQWRPSAAPNTDAFADPVNVEVVFGHDWREARLVTLFQYPQAHRRADGSIEVHNGAYHYRPGTTDDIFVHKNLIRRGLAYEAIINAEVTFLDKPYEVPVWFLQATEIGIDLVRSCKKVPKTSA
jgi:hypothetical protein